MRFISVAMALCGLVGCNDSGPKQSETGAAATQASQVLQVILIPADGGTEDGTRADFQPLFDAISKNSSIKFNIRVAQSYNAVVEALCSGSADIAFVGPAIYLQASRRGCADLLAVGVENGRSEYFAGIFARTNGGPQALSDLKGKSIAFGDVNSASSFIVPVAMLLNAKLDPLKDVGRVRIVGSHANAISALTHGQVDAAALSLVSFDKAINQGSVKASDIGLIATSIALPNPPIVMRSTLSQETKIELKSAFKNAATSPNVPAESLVGYGGKRVERYDTDFAPEKFAPIQAMMDQVTPELTAALLDKAAKP
jgi:phosphonate transport system substrate-binding protein